MHRFYIETTFYCTKVIKCWLFILRNVCVFMFNVVFRNHGMKFAEKKHSPEVSFIFGNYQQH